MSCSRTEADGEKKSQRGPYARFHDPISYSIGWSMTLKDTKWNCFVASAFGHADVNAIYDEAIVPVLESQGVKAIRVDRENHNEDVDDMIFAMLDEADLCIADLTYARPSVYYEAGYAAGKRKPVIYVARKDHFKARDSDPCGNLRVHFDLQMKNIIAWDDPCEAFKSTLASRLRLVLEPMAIRGEPWGRMAVSERFKILETAFTRLVRSAGFKYREEIDEPKVGKPRRYYYSMRGKTLQLVVFVATSDAGLADWYFLFEPLLRNPSYDFLGTLGHPKIAKHLVLISLCEVPREALGTKLHSWRQVDDMTFIQTPPAPGFSAQSVDLRILDGFRTPADYTDRMAAIVGELAKG